MANSPYRYGDVIDGRYRVREPIGKGGMGGVYLAEHINFQRRVALKVLLGSAAADRVARERFVTEARAVCHLQHPNLVTYHDFGTDPRTGHLYLVMELLEGKSLARVLKTEKPLPTTRVLHMIGQLCDALHESHEAGVIHRDLKPANVMIVQRGQDPDFVKLIDFGIVRVLEGTAGRGAPRRPLTDAGMVIGTTAYLAPEYIRHQSVDARTDIYALGIMCYELIAGHRPFEHPTALEVMRMHLSEPPRPLTELQDGREVPRELNQAILSALEKDPKARVSTVLELKAELLRSAAPLLDRDAATATRKAPGMGSDPVTVSARPPAEVADGLTGLGEAPTEARTGPAPVTATTHSMETTHPARAGLIAGVALATVSIIGLGWWLTRGPVEPAPAPTPPAARASAAPRAPEPTPSRRSRRTTAVTYERGAEMRITPLAGKNRRSAWERASRRDLRRRGPEPTPAPVSTRRRPGEHRDTVAAGTGKVRILVTPYGRVYHGKRYLGEDLVPGFRAPAGRQCFRAGNPVHGTRTGCVRVQPDRTVRLRIKLN